MEMIISTEALDWDIMVHQIQTRSSSNFRTPNVSMEFQWNQEPKSWNVGI